ncbi:homocysteine S-methyltransferase family protein [Pelotomaculum propionicicum]|uniref:homocysteine S-methyltransferase family protein n=1 Tax=Pelotomaculum propionicicum TaxID=258475 RepID=UPI003B7CCEB4
MADFIATLKNQVLLGDGAMGTMLVKQGLPPGENPELWMLSHPLEVQQVHLAYLNAGSQVIQTNTFGGTALKLGEYGAAHLVEEVNKTAAKLVREVVQDKAFVAGIIGPTGHFPAPLGDISWTELAEVFGRQARALEAGGVDFILLETFTDLGEIRAALFAAKKYTKLPVACSLTYTKGRTLTGASPQTAAIVLEAMGADCIGANCSTGPAELLEIMKEYRQFTRLPLLVEPNAGMPVLINGETVFKETPQELARFAEPFRSLGVNLIGACCGSTPAHIKAMGEALSSREPTPLPPQEGPFSTRLASRSRALAIGAKELPVLIGERINPSARKAVAEALRRQNWDFITNEGALQLDSGALLLDLNTGLAGGDETRLLPEGVRQLQMSLDCPLVLDCTNPAALEKGLQEFQGKALINSVNGERKSLDSILPLAKKYGAAVLGLTLNESGIPAKAEERLDIAKQIVDAAEYYGLPREDIMIDCLVLTAATSPELASETVRAITLVKKHLGVNTVLGLSNVSHGLPQRSWLNAAFLSLALGAGLDAAIANPLDNRIRETMISGALLTGRDFGARNYLEQAGKLVSPAKPSINKDTDQEDPVQALQKAIFHGHQEAVVPLVKKLLEKGDVLSVINEGIIPALEIMGQHFARGEAYLPQLILAGDTAKKAFAYLKENFSAQKVEQQGTVVIGTVKGDIHDIGKNIVSALLENHGYRVVDLGKSVSAQAFLEAARREKADVVALSALMTTTMVEMPQVIELLKQELPDVKVIVGGAVVTAEYAREIGADSYGADAVEAVKVVRGFSLAPKA